MMDEHSLQSALLRIGIIGKTQLRAFPIPSTFPFAAVKVLCSPRFNEWGRGTNLSEAHIGGLMERVERISAYLASRFIRIQRLAPKDTSQTCLGLTELGLCNIHVFGNIADSERAMTNDFVEAKRMSDGNSVLVPASRVLHRFPAFVRDFSCTTGLAAHFDREEAILRAVLEVVERHVHHLIAFNNLLSRRVILPSQFERPSLDGLVNSLLEYGFDIRVFSFDLVDSLSCIYLVLRQKGDNHRNLNRAALLHTAVHWDPQIALERAITETLIARLASGWLPTGERDSGDRKGFRKASQNSSTLEPKRSSGDVSFEQLRKTSYRGIALVNELAKSLHSEVLWTDLTHPKLGIPVVRVLLPGLQPNFDLLGFDILDPRSRVSPHLQQYSSVTESARAGHFTNQTIIETRILEDCARHTQGVAAQIKSGRRTNNSQRKLPAPILEYQGGRRVSVSLPLAKSVLHEIIARRRSCRRVSGLINIRDLSVLLRQGVGPNAINFNRKWGFVLKRHYPSAGARHPLEVFVEVRNCASIEKGIYHYEVRRQELVNLSGSTAYLIDGTERRLTTQEERLNPAAIIRIVAKLSRTSAKYGTNAVRFAALEAGHLAHNFLLLATDLGLNAVPLGNCAVPGIRKALALQADEILLYSIAIGYA